jgi:uncharacterized membrane protein
MVAVNPFAWFYLNEARPYAMQLGLTLASIACLIRLKSQEMNVKVLSQWLALLCLSTCLLSMASMLGMIWASATFLLLPVLFSVRTLVGWVRNHLALVCGTAVVLAICAAYYLWTRWLRVQPTNVGATTWQTLAFIFYEQLGFNGLGPGRLSLRQSGSAALKPWLPLLCVYGFLVCFILFVAFRELFRSYGARKVFLAITALGFPAIFLVAAGFWAPFRVLGRHFTPLTGAIVFLFTLGGIVLWRSPKRWHTAGFSVFMAFLLLSCLSERFGSRHRKDDNRKAAAIAKNALNQRQLVWWNADFFSGLYYHVPISTESANSGKAWLVGFPTPDFDKVEAKPDLVIVSSKADIFDPADALRSFLRREGYAPQEYLTAFTIFRKSANGFPTAAVQQR